MLNLKEIGETGPTLPTLDTTMTNDTPGGTTAPFTTIVDDYGGYSIRTSQWGGRGTQCQEDDAVLSRVRWDDENGESRVDLARATGN